MAGSWIDDQIWRSVLGDLVLNSDAAIYKYWRSLRAGDRYLGPPVTPEIDTPTGVQQGFSSGAVISWTAEDGASLAHDE